MNNAQYAESEAFKSEKIYPQIVRDWRGEDLVHEWLTDNAPRYTLSTYLDTAGQTTIATSNSGVNRGADVNGIDSVALWRSSQKDHLIKIYEEFSTTSVAFWTALSAADPTVIANQKANTLRIEKDLIRRRRFLDILNNRTGEPENDKNSSTSTSISSSSPKSNFVSPATKKDTRRIHQELLPTGMYTALTVFARIPPGAEISAGCRGIASMLARGEIPLEWSPAQIIEHIEPLGGLAFLIYQPADPRLR